jgi:hypothetical protein
MNYILPIVFILSVFFTTTVYGREYACNVEKGPSETKNRFSDDNFSSKCYYCQQRIRYVLNGCRYKKIGRFDAKLTKACREGIFVPRVHAQYYAVLHDADVDIAWGNGKNLLDTTGLAKTDEVYYFFRAGWVHKPASDPSFKRDENPFDQRCEVYVRKDSDP